ncbi:hypothetical protein M0R88_09020 [Halorussus gelatinilyticus]|uniref:Uncharacterized protein n=1 Tax=Halorussus gelatinilyticus TaxID=2937524 RepID=A0A8U0IM58_9EURY|nr:hypothetical protein [Halorussus gelatinilyticus]UPW02220.1 hypothetical protein M0R88_09020 [Halorussus gelatinilyticus]
MASGRDRHVGRLADRREVRAGRLLDGLVERRAALAVQRVGVVPPTVPERGGEPPDAVEPLPEASPDSGRSNDDRRRRGESGVAGQRESVGEVREECGRGQRPDADRQFRTAGFRRRPAVRRAESGDLAGFDDVRLADY